MDDTIENLSVAWLDFLNKKYGRSVKREDISEWDISKCYPGVPKEDVYAVLDEDELWKSVVPTNGAVDAVKHLINAGHEVYIVTASHYKALESKMKNVLFKYFPFISWDNVIISHNKQMIKGDVLIDDGIHNLIGGEYNKILIDTPYNAQFEEWRYGILRTKTWEEVISAIDGMNQAGGYVGVKNK